MLTDEEVNALVSAGYDRDEIERVRKYLTPNSFRELIPIRNPVTHTRRIHNSGPTMVITMENISATNIVF